MPGPAPRKSSARSVFNASLFARQADHLPGHEANPQFTRAPQLTIDQALAFAASFGIDPDDPLVRSTFAAIADTGAAIEVLNQRQGHVAEIPAANAIGNARSLARLYGAVIGEVDGIRLLSRQAVERAAAPRTDQLPPPAPFDKLPDRYRSRFGLGYELPRPGLPMLGDGSFGHAGAGGGLAFGQPRTRTAVGYLCTNMSWNPSAGADPRWLPWTSALAGAVGADLAQEGNRASARRPE